MKICSLDECDRPHRARGYCSTHYNRTAYTEQQRRQFYLRTIECAWCGRTHQTSRSNGRFCSRTCFGAMLAYEAGNTSCPLPTPKAPPEPRISSRLYRVYFPDCRWCGSAFCTQQPAQEFCSRGCQRRWHKRARKARQYGAVGTYTWTEVMGLFLLFGRCCAYCEQPIDGQPDPDHVVPLSRGGSNSITNILPSCRTCNSEKNDRTLDEWTQQREQDGLPKRVTQWRRGDPRFAHLVISGKPRPRRSHAA